MTFREAIFEELKKPGKHSLGDIAANVGCGYHYVSKVLSAGHYGKLTTKVKIQVAYLWGQDRCVTEISEKTKISKRRLIHFLQNEGLT